MYILINVFGGILSIYYNELLALKKHTLYSNIHIVIICNYILTIKLCLGTLESGFLASALFINSEQCSALVCVSLLARKSSRMMSTFLGLALLIGPYRGNIVMSVLHNFNVKLSARYANNVTQGIQKYLANDLNLLAMQLVIYFQYLCPNNCC